MFVAHLCDGILEETKCETPNYKPLTRTLALEVVLSLTRNLKMLLVKLNLTSHVKRAIFLLNGLLPLMTVLLVFPKKKFNDQDRLLFRLCRVHKSLKKLCLLNRD